MRLTKLIVPLFAVYALLAAQSDPSGRVGRLSYRNGPVSFQPAGVMDWVDADVNRPLTTGDQVWVGDGGRAEIHVGSTAFRLDSNTAFQFLNLDDQTIQIQLSQGTLTVRARNLAQHQNLELDTPNLAFTVLRPGEYRIDAGLDSRTTSVVVRDGYGEVTGGGRTFPVQPRQRAIVTGDEESTYDLVSAPMLDEWDQWNMSRDRRAEESPSARYVSQELGGYEDFDQYGSWQNEPEYGQVWMPTGVSAGWAPYHDGHWAWIAPWGWTWIDDAPWGFTPYHYGRWASFRGHWGWIPGPRGVAPTYAPALVAWIGGGRGGSGFSLSFSFGNAAAVGWFPLGPREPYFPSYQVSSGYFGRVNHSNTVIDNRTINNYYIESNNGGDRAYNNIRYANRDVRNAVTAVPQARFADGRRVSEYGRAVPGVQLGNARYAAAPQIAPQRASVLGPRAGESTRAPRPPAAALRRPVVARTAPPQAPVPFERQQAELNRNPGRPIPAATVRQMERSAPARSAPVRVEDMSRVERVQPTVGSGPQRGAARNSSDSSRTGEPNRQPPPVANGRQNEATRQQNTPPPNAVQPPNGQPPPAANEARNQPPSNPQGKKNDRSAVPAPRPEALPPNTPPRQQNTLPPNGVKPPSTNPPERQQTDKREKPAPQGQPERQQADKREKPAPQAQPERQQTQNPPQKQQPQAKPASTEKPTAESRPKEKKDKPEKNDDKQ